ncbi:hypothetical protein ACFE04_024856 [Oxalis oulophora]
MAAGDKRTRPTTSPKSKPNYSSLPEDLTILLTSAVSSSVSSLRRHDLRLLPSQSIHLESLLSSVYSSLPQPPQSSFPQLPPPSPWFDRLLSSAADQDSNWTNFFHISKPNFTYLNTILSPFLFNSLPTIPPKTALAATLYRLANGASYKCVARNFGFESSAVACRVFYSVCKVVNDKFGDLLDFGSDIGRISVGFQCLSLPNCCGVLGFGRFEVDLDVLGGSNGSLLVQALVDSECRFLDISAGWPCTLKPDSILRQTKLFSRVEESKEILNGPCYDFGNGDSIPQYVLGGSCFPLFPWLLTPFVVNEEDSFGSAEKKFNSAHSRAMKLLGTAFGRVKARWQLLSKKWEADCVEFLPYVIVTGCLLHNFLITRDEPFMDDNSGQFREEEFPVFEGEGIENGGMTRDVLAHYLGQAKPITKPITKPPPPPPPPPPPSLWKLKIRCRVSCYSAALRLMSSKPIKSLYSSELGQDEFSLEAQFESTEMMDSTKKQEVPNGPNKKMDSKPIPKITENVVINPSYDPRKMDPLVKPPVVSNANNKTAKPGASSEPYTSTMSVDSGQQTMVQANVKVNETKNSRSNSLESSTAPLKPHTGGDVRWDAVNLVLAKGCPIGLSHFRLLKRLGYGDIGSVYLTELRGTGTYFAMKVMDKASLASRNKLLRAQTEREILGLLDHPFLPTLYSYFETDKFYCLVMEFCSGGNLHSLRQKQPNKHFTEEAARFYASEVLLALEYLHMLGIVYRDLKPENVLVRVEGHIMLSDFDLSLRCSVNPTLVKSSSAHVTNDKSSGGGGGGGMLDEEYAVHGCIQPSSFFPKILPGKKSRKSKSDFGLFVNGSLPELMAEPTNVRSMSFVGTHEYLAPEIIRGEGHGSAVDWWTFGIFLYELLHGITPFKGQGNRATLFNVVGQPLRFPDSPQVSGVARDLIRGLLVKEPHKRIAYKRGATEIKQHPFFEGVNWALVRSAMPPHVPEPPFTYTFELFMGIHYSGLCPKESSMWLSE